MGRYRFSILLAALLSLMVFSPIAAMIRAREFPILSPVLTTLLFSAVLLSAVFAVARHRQTIVLFGSAMGIEFVLQAVGLFFEPPWLLALQFAVGGGMLAFVIVLLLRFLFLEQRVTFEVIAASICGYLLLGVFWAYAFSLLELVEQKSFAIKIEEAATADGEADGAQVGAHRTALALYFSYVTLTTLGYGDIVPATTPARMLCTVEAIMGQLYLAVLVARLVGLHIAQHSRREPD